jgi:hypothetical protein
VLCSSGLSRTALNGMMLGRGCGEDDASVSDDGMESSDDDEDVGEHPRDDGAVSDDEMGSSVRSAGDAVTDGELDAHAANGAVVHAGAGVGDDAMSKGGMSAHAGAPAGDAARVDAMSDVEVDADPDTVDVGAPGTGAAGDDALSTVDVAAHEADVDGACGNDDVGSGEVDVMGWVPAAEVGTRRAANRGRDGDP